jgi:AraC-like DNA-binding protein
MACGASYVLGVWDTALVMEWPRTAQLVGVTFRPGGAAPFLSLPLGELRDQVAPLDAIWGRAAAEELRERLAAASTPQERLALFERLFLVRLARLGQVSHRRDPTRDPALALTQHAVDELARGRGARAIQALSQQLGLSHSHLITQFQRLVGTTPKALARLYRLQRVLERLDPDPAHPHTWAQVAQQADYYDEPHFNHDFAAFTGLTPTDYLQGLRRFHAEHPGSAHALAPRFLPAG